MPLNNNGDKVRLLNPAGDTVHEVEYAEGQVSPSQFLFGKAIDQTPT